MNVVVKEQIAPVVRYYSGVNPCTGATVHMTANTKRGADAQAHANLQSRGGVKAGSWHVSIDDREAIQSFEDFRKCWHAGDGKGPGNSNTIAYELCVNADGDYVKMLHNAAQRISMDVVEYGWDRGDIHQHNEFSPWGKNCPRELRGSKEDISWSQFVDLIFEYAKGKPVSKPSKPKPKPEDPTPKSDYPLLKTDGAIGTHSISRGQEFFSTREDGMISSQPVYWKKVHTALIPGPVEFVANNRALGSLYVEAWQRWAGVDDDGLLGQDSVKGIQRKLKRLGYYHGVIDGKMSLGGPTATGWQRYLNDKAKGK